MFYLHNSIRKAFWNGVDFDTWWHSCKRDYTFDFGITDPVTVMHWKARFNVVMHEKLMPLMLRHTMVDYPAVG